MNKTCIFNKTLTVEMLSILLLTNKAPQLIGQTRRLALKIPNHFLTTLDSTRHFYVQNKTQCAVHAYMIKVQKCLQTRL